MDWLLSDRSLPLRVTVGVIVFASLAAAEVRRRGWRDARRWREYVFLIVCVAAAIVYGIANDLLTSRISPEYFLFFKGAADRVSAEAAAEPALHRAALDYQAMRIGALATWTAGLLAGALLLTANSLGPWPSLSLRRLARFMPLLFVLAIAFAVLLGVAGYRGGLTWTSDDFRQMVSQNEMRAYRLMCVYGIHLGGYLGAGAGLAVAIACVLLVRQRLSRLP